MPDTWTVNADGSVDKNGVLLANPFYVKLSVEWNTQLAILEAYVEAEVPNTQEISQITQVLSVVPNIDTLAHLHVYQPRTLYTSHPGDTINVGALSLTQQTSRPDKLGV